MGTNTMEIYFFKLFSVFSMHRIIISVAPIWLSTAPVSQALYFLPHSAHCAVMAIRNMSISFIKYIRLQISVAKQVCWRYKESQLHVSTLKKANLERIFPKYTIYIKWRLLILHGKKQRLMNDYVVVKRFSFQINTLKSF